MKIINHQQGSAEWKAHRRTTRNASDFPSAQGLSKKFTRSALVAEHATGIEREFSPYVAEKILPNGHRIEALARPMAEEIIGEELYPLVAVSDDGYLGASSDGATMCRDIGWECKQWNAELAEAVASGFVPDTHVGQVDQQGEVFGFEKILFMVTDGTPENCVHCWHVPSEEAKAKIRPTWRQFDEDVANYQPEVIEAKPILHANPIDNLPALFIEVTGRVTASNLVEFKAAATAVISSIKTELVTDQDFVDATAAVKYLKDVEDSAKRAKQNALDQTASIAELHRALDEVAGMAATVRKALDKKITEEKDSRKAEIVIAASRALGEHCAALGHRVGVPVASAASFGDAIKGLKSLDSMRDKVSAALANAKIESSATADRFEANIKSLECEGQSWRFLFPDLQAVCTKASDDFAALLAARKASHAAAESARIEKIRAEEKAKAEAAAAAKVAEEARIAKAEADAKAATEKAEADRLAAEEIRKIDEQRKAQAMERAKQLAEEASAAMPVEAQKQTVEDHTEQPLALVDQLPDATKMIDDRSGPRITSLRIQISDELGKMNVFELGNVLAYCQALPLKNKLAA